ncbi:YtxH domain-containing protein [Clostridium oryzae]|uniref:YtxH-like protein n=1 Tax=Clostridium oryzae TaxID=1450648 RepID=A0A1V4IGN7_9CLOT|nr:YtxH domain-containing protein [Clostridium oryzae]OPJ59004.1 hypothetical protein CLORY_34940 [Clostridium oryzae]
MRRGFISGMTTGAIIGAAMGIMVIPRMDRNTVRKLKRVDRMVMNAADNIYSSIMK